MAQFRVLQTAFIGGQLRQAGDIVDADFDKGDDLGGVLEPIKAAKSAKGAKPEADAEAEGADLV